MAKETKKQEVAVIDFEKFSIAQLPELQGKKEEIKGVIEANPVVEIVDNSTYELAKKSRTAVKTLRTSLEKEQKDVKKKIKEHVLDVVDKEYDTLVLGVKSAEQTRQKPITAWEEKKEQERLEKARLEEERVNSIKKSISDFRRNWDDVIFTLTFDKIEEVRENYSVAVLEFDRSKLAEFEVLFDDAIVYLDNLFANKEKTLVEQEQIRVENSILQEKNAENSRIQEWQRTWNANIDTLSFDDVKDVKAILVKSKLADLKHYSAEYNEIYNSTEKRLHSQIELISKAEEQRIAQEKFQKEKAEFEAKQKKAKIEERTSVFKNLGLEFGNFNGANACYGNQKLNLFYPVLYITDATDERFEEVVSEIKQKIVEFNQPKEEVKIYEISQENYHEEDVHEVATAKHIQEENSLEEAIKNNGAYSYNDEYDGSSKPIRKEEEKELLYTGTFKNLTETFASFELIFLVEDLPKFEHLTLKEFLKDFNIPTKKQ